jgi:hypothetical protein
MTHLGTLRPASGVETGGNAGIAYPSQPSFLGHYQALEAPGDLVEVVAQPSEFRLELVEPLDATIEPVEARVEPVEAILEPVDAPIEPAFEAAQVPERKKDEDGG